MNIFSKKKLWIVLTAVMGALTAICIALLCVGIYYAEIINVFLEADTQKVIPEPGAKIYYWTDYENEGELVEYGKSVCKDIVGEGASLLHNDGVLPLKEGTKFSCFSQSSVDPIYAGTGSASVTDDDVVSLNTALTEVFGEGSTNLDLVRFYTTSGYKRVNAALSGGSPEQYRINEVPWSKYSEPLKNTFKNYGDVALVVLARSGGEGADLPSGLDSLKPYMTDGDYLRLCREEMELLQNLKDLKDKGTFKNIVVLLNMANIMQVDFVDKYDVDAVLWTGNVGATGMSAVADILCGKIVPSGRIADTVLKDNHSSPAMVNFGAYAYTNASEYDLEEAQNNTQKGIVKANKNYVVYQEGIYVGYRYYETRYEDYVLGQGNAGTFDYNSVVAYPFGSGMSYVNFEYSDFDVEEKADTFEVTVKVKNTGNIAAKHTVQIYFQSPYGAYEKENAVEKSAVEICGFDKKEIKKGATETYTITVRKEDLTSYDHMKAKTYIMSEGDYYFTAATDAHNAVNNILMAKKANGIAVDESKMSGSGNAALAKKWNKAEIDTETYSVSKATGKKISNLFEEADLNKYEGTKEQKITYLTRQDWTGTFPKKTVELKVTDKMWEDGLTHDESGRAAIMEKYKKLYYSDVTTMPKTGAEQTLSIADFCEKEFKSPDWDTLISQMTYADLIDFIGNGAYQTKPVESLGMPGTRASDGPYGYTKPLSGGGHGMCFPCESVLASSYNTSLAEKEGKCIAEDLIHASLGSGNTFYTAIYAPGANIHRTPYSGRNGEYYSEDGFLSGKMCAAESAGIRLKGVTAVPKHFALNDQEEGRYGISTWSNEQAIRELYLEGFEEFSSTGGTALMSSFNRIGVVWSGAHRGLMTGILRDEWGMNGMTVTDMASSAKYMDYRAGILAGTTLWLGYSNGMISMAPYADDAAIVTAYQSAMKHNAYTVSRTHAMNVGHAKIVKIMPWWEATVIAIICVFGVLAVGSAAMLTLSLTKFKDAAKTKE